MKNASPTFGRHICCSSSSAAAAAAPRQMRALSCRNFRRTAGNFRCNKVWHYGRLRKTPRGVFHWDKLSTRSLGEKHYYQDKDKGHKGFVTVPRNALNLMNPQNPVARLCWRHLGHFSLNCLAHKIRYASFSISSHAECTWECINLRWSSSSASTTPELRICMCISVVWKQKPKPSTWLPPQELFLLNLACRWPFVAIGKLEWGDWALLYCVLASKILEIDSMIQSSDFDGFETI